MVICMNAIGAEMCRRQDGTYNHLWRQAQPSSSSRRKSHGEHHVGSRGHATLRLHHQQGLARRLRQRLSAPSHTLWFHHGYSLRLHLVSHHHPRPDEVREPDPAAAAAGPPYGVPAPVAFPHIRPPAEATDHGRAADVAARTAAASGGRECYCRDHHRSKLHRGLDRRHHVHYGSSNKYNRGRR